jgi:hypothetical protein
MASGCRGFRLGTVVRVVVADALIQRRSARRNCGEIGLADHAIE